VDAGCLAVVFGAVRGSRGGGGGGLAVGSASLLEALQAGAGAAGTSPCPGVKGEGWQLKIYIYPCNYIYPCIYIMGSWAKRPGNRC
jgi:hypothetical protein